MKTSAADWLFSHMGDDEADVTPAISGGDAGATSTEVRGDGRYKLIGVISHMGKNTEHGHYVCHLWRNGKWVLYNDDKVKIPRNTYQYYTFPDHSIFIHVGLCQRKTSA